MTYALFRRVLFFGLVVLLSAHYLSIAMNEKERLRRQERICEEVRKGSFIQGKCLDIGLIQIEP